jgi:peptidoglycan/LPS O-acetylase OafA/YrhL
MKCFVQQNNISLKYSNLMSIDMARGFAALSVFIYHYGVGSVLEKTTGLPVFKAVSIPGAIYAVPLFFIVSGFCIHWSQLRQEQKQGNTLSCKKYIVRRFWRIYPTYLIVLLFSCAVQAMENHRVEVWDFLMHLVLLQGFSVVGFNSINLVLWTISIEAMFYLLYPLWYKVRNLFGLNFSLCLGLAVSVTSWIVCALWMFPYTLPEKWFVLNLWGSWLVGAWLAENIFKDKTTFSKPIWWLMGIGAILVTATCQQFGFFTGRGEVVWSGILTILWIWPMSALILSEKYLLSLAGKWWWWIVKSIVICGQFSYSLYLLHMPLMYLRNLLWSGIENTTVRTAIWFLGFFVILAISLLSYQLFEKPFMQYRIQGKIS